MSQIFDYIYLKDKRVKEVKSESVTAALEIGKHEFVSETDLCEPGIVRDLFIGEINNGTIIFGNGITYKMIHKSTNRNNFLLEFPDCEIFSKAYDDRVMIFGFALGKNGKFICAREGGDGSFTEGSTTKLEEEIRLNNKEFDEQDITYKLMQKFEEQYLGKSIDKFDCKEIKLLKYQSN